MTTKRMLFCVFLAFSLSSIAGPCVAAKISLTYVTSHAASQSSSESIHGQIKVSQAGIKKSVNVLYQTRDQGWKSVPATYLFSTNQDTEIWAFDIRSEQVLQFSVQLLVDGRLYQDNNQGRNYHLSPGVEDAIAISPAVHIQGIKQIGSSQPALSGQVLIRNLSYSKKVRIVYTDDNWATVKLMNAHYEKTFPSGTELWRYEAPLTEDVRDDEIHLAIEYVHDQGTDWDNNFFSNYRVRFGLITH